MNSRSEHLGQLGPKEGSTTSADQLYFNTLLDGW